MAVTAESAGESPYGNHHVCNSTETGYGQNMAMAFNGHTATTFIYDHMRSAPTVQTFNSCTHRPDVCQCLVVHTSMDNMSKNKPSSTLTLVADESKLRSVVRSETCGRIHAQETRWQSGMRSCIMPGYPGI